MALRFEFLSLALALGVVAPAMASAAPPVDGDAGLPSQMEADPTTDPETPAQDAPVSEMPPPQTTTTTSEPPVAAEPVQSTVTAEAPADAPADAPAEAPDPKSGERLRPPNEDMLTGKHEVDLGKATFKPGSGLVIQSTDGRFALETRLRAQFLYTLENEDETGETSHGFQIRRARLQFKGHVFNEHNQFKAEFALSPRDMGYDGSVGHQTPILDWYLDFDYLRDFSVRIGQAKVPYSRQRVVSSGDLELVDRSLANGEFNLDRDIGVDFRSEDFLGLDKLRYYAGVYFGEGRDQLKLSNFDMFYVARVEVLPFGMFKDYKEADFDRGLRPRLSIGAAYAFVDGAVGNRGILGSAPSDGGTTDYHNVTADVMFKIAGFSLFADVFYRQGKRNFGDAVVVDDAGVEAPAPRELARNGLGWSAAPGYMIPRLPLQLVARYSQVGNLGRESSLSRADEVGGGVNYYIAGHPMKLQLDYFAHYGDGQISHADHIVRLQLQAGF